MWVNQLGFAFFFVLSFYSLTSEMWEKQWSIANLLDRSRILHSTPLNSFFFLSFGIVRSLSFIFTIELYLQGSDLSFGKCFGKFLFFFYMGSAWTGVNFEVVHQGFWLISEEWVEYSIVYDLKVWRQTFESWFYHFLDWWTSNVNSLFQLTNIAIVRNKLIDIKYL